MLPRLILIVDLDNRTNSLLQECFTAEGYSVMTANSSREGFLLFKQHNVHLIISEGRFTGEPNFQFVKKIKELSSVPIVILSDLSHESQRIQGFELGVADYVTKPFSPREVSLRVDRLLSYFYSPASFKVVGNFYVFSFMSLDLTNRHVEINQKIIKLTPREFQLLRYFAEHADQVISRRDLLQEVWGYEYFGEERTVDVHIRKLRNKLSLFSPLAAKAIQTEWKRGYRLNTAPRIERK